jgi:hypothetical protein
MTFWAHTVVWRGYSFSATVLQSLTPCRPDTYFFYYIENSPAIPASKVIHFWAHKVRKAQARHQIKYTVTKL